MEDWIGNSSSVGFIRFEDEKESFVVCCRERSECGYLLKRLIVFDVGELESPHKRRESLCAKP